MKKYPILYSFRRCPFAIRARMALAYSDVRVELREVKLADKAPEFVALSTKATVPVLQLAEGGVLDESLDIIDWALSVKDPDGWLVTDKQGLIRENDEIFKPLLDRYKYADRFPQLSQFEHRQAAMPFLGQLNRQLEVDDYLAGNHLSCVDVAILPFVRQFAGVEPDWFANSELAALRQWLQKLVASSLFKRIMTKYAFWQAGDSPVFFAGD